MRLAATAGLCAGLAPDLDVLIQSADDPLLQLEYHRHFSHALIMAPLGGVLVAALLWLLPPLRHSGIAWWRLAAFATLGFACGGLLDACTSYGTRLLWPFSDQRLAWNSIAIVDPLFTLIVLLGGLLAWRRRQPWVARGAVVLALGYLALGAAQRERAEDLVQDLAHDRGHAIDAAVVKPTLGNIVLWRAVYRADDRYYIDAVRVGLSSAEAFTGTSIPALELTRDFPALARQPATRLYQDVQRFGRLSEGFLVRHPRYPDVIGDVRYAMLPDSAAPLWGITVDPERAEQHAPFRAYRDFSETDRRRFFAMLFGG